MKKWGIFAAFTVAAAVGLTACGSNTDTAATAAVATTAEATGSVAGTTAETSTAAADGAGTDVAAKAAGGEVTKDDIIIAQKSDISTLDPMGTNDTTSSVAHRHIYSRLLEVNEDAKIVGDLAESWEQASDTEWKFKLQEGVKFHDGSELKAGDVKFSLERAKEMPRVKQLVEQIESITVEDDYNLTLHLSEPYALLLSALSHTGTSIIPEALVTAQGEAFWENPVGSGPYEIPGMGS